MAKKRASKSSTKAGSKRKSKGGRGGGCNVVFLGGPLDGREMLIDDVRKNRSRFRHAVLKGGKKSYEDNNYYYEKSNEPTIRGLSVFVLVRTERFIVTVHGDNQKL